MEKLHTRYRGAEVTLEPPSKPYDMGCFDAIFVHDGSIPNYDNRFRKGETYESEVNMVQKSPDSFIVLYLLYRPGKRLKEVDACDANAMLYTYPINSSLRQLREALAHLNKFTTGKMYTLRVERDGDILGADFLPPSNPSGGTLFEKFRKEIDRYVNALDCRRRDREKRAKMHKIGDEGTILAR